MKMKKTIENITVCLVAVFCLLFGILFFAIPKKEFSENENRYLSKLDKPDWESVKSGTYMNDLTDYVVDHFPGRDLFMGIKTKSDILSGKKQIGNIYIGKDGYYIEAYNAPKETQTRIDILKRFSENEALTGKNVQMMLVPTAVTILQEKLPPFVDSYTVSQLDTIEEIYAGTGISPVRVENILLEHKDEYIYYRLDHHWTTLGAYYAYTVYCEEAGLIPESLSGFTGTVVSEEFRGTIYSKVNDYGVKGDSITSYSHPEDQLTVTYTDTGEVTSSLYNPEYLEKKDKYSYFLNNLHSLIVVENENAVTDRVLVLLKDSYANSMVPFLAHHFKTIYVFDTRSYKSGVAKFLEEHADVTDVLFLYNMNTFDTDLGIKAVY